MKYRYAIGGALVASAVLFSLSTSVAIAAECDPLALRATNFGQTGAHVKALQSCLLAAKFDIPAGATGYFGTQTKAALQTFYRTALDISDWDGRSIGPKGRAALVLRTQGVTVNVHASSGGGAPGLKRIASETEITKYIEASRSVSYRSISLGLSSGAVTMGAPTVALSSADSSVPATTPMVPLPTTAGETSATPSRVSETNVQVAGIDEPDIVKTDGTTIYFSREGYARWYSDVLPTPMMDCVNCGIMPPTPQKEVGVTAVTAFPLSSLGIASDAIVERGQMLLVKDKHLLVILAYDKIVAYDVTDPTKPTKKWTNELKNNTQVVAARLKGGTMSLVTSTYLSATRPCPIIPIMRGGVSIAIPCGDIWVPVSVEPANVSYSIFAVDPTTGTETTSTTILGDSNNTTVYVSENNIYLAYRMQNATTNVIMSFLRNETTGFLSTTTIERIRVVDGYDISLNSKMTEIGKAVELELASLSENDRMLFENELENRMKSYLDTHLRDTDRTTIARIPLATLTVASSGVVPGHLLNQFSMDEWGGNLRTAVTVGDRWGFGGSKMVNDVYVFDESLKALGSILDLGVTERIYAARFIGNRGYLVTFRQTDPFYVLDLSLPTAPKMTGELKIPGYSAYLEPLSETMILGVGREDGGVKLAIFDVSNPASPTEKAKYSLKDSWTEVEGNHHAFLRDEKHKVFFLPGGQGGYVLSYDGDAFTLKATVAGYQVKRAVYIEDNLYIIGEEKITVYDETTLKEVKTLELK